MAIQSSVFACGLADKRVVNSLPKYPNMPLTQEQVESEEFEKAKMDLLIAKMNKWQRFNNIRNKK